MVRLAFMNLIKNYIPIYNRFSNLHNTARHNKSLKSFFYYGNVCLTICGDREGCPTITEGSNDLE